jgi:hypothetical protein
LAQRAIELPKATRDEPTPRGPVGRECAWARGGQGGGEQPTRDVARTPAQVPRCCRAGRVEAHVRMTREVGPVALTPRAADGAVRAVARASTEVGRRSGRRGGSCVDGGGERGGRRRRPPPHPRFGSRRACRRSARQTHRRQQGTPANCARSSPRLARASRASPAR